MDVKCGTFVAASAFNEFRRNYVIEEVWTKEKVVRTFEKNDKIFRLCSCSNVIPLPQKQIA